MTVQPGWPAVSGAATFQHIRRSLAGQVVRSAAGALRKGILPFDATAVVTGTASMNVAVGQFVAVIDRNGAVFVPNDGSVNVLLSSAPASGSRWSVVYVKQRESESPFSDGATGPVLDKVESTTSEAAARALLPAGGLELAVVKVDAGSATTNAVGVTITQTFLYTAMSGGVVWVRNGTELGNWTPADGSLAWLMDSAVLVVRGGGAWKLAAPIETRVAVDSASIANGTTILTTSFPALPFATIVDVEYLGQVGNTSGSAGTYVPGMAGGTGAGVTVTEANMALYNVASGQWVAVPRDARVTIPANVAATHTIIASSTQTGQWRGRVRTNRRSA